jgi:hypothetical protein
MSLVSKPGFSGLLPEKELDGRLKGNLNDSENLKETKQDPVLLTSLHPTETTGMEAILSTPNTFMSMRLSRLSELCDYQEEPGNMRDIPHETSPRESDTHRNISFRKRIAWGTKKADPEIFTRIPRANNARA